MTPDPDLARLLDHASMFVEQAFRHQGVIHPMWIAVDPTGKELVVPPPVPFVNQAARDYATTVMRAMFALSGVTRYVFVCESWILLAEDAPIDIEAVQRDGIPAKARLVRRRLSFLRRAVPDQRERDDPRHPALAVMSALAKQDRIPIVERVKAGLQRARLHGTRSGRPIGGQRIPAKKEREVAAALLKGDRGMQKIARELSVGVSVVQRVKASLNGRAP